MTATATTTRSIWTEADGWLLPEVPPARPDSYHLCMSPDTRLLSLAEQLGYRVESRCFSRYGHSCYFLGTLDDFLDLEQAIAQLERVGVSRDRLMVNPGPYSVWIYSIDMEEIARAAESHE